MPCNIIQEMSQMCHSKRYVTRKFQKWMMFWYHFMMMKSPILGIVLYNHKVLKITYRYHETIMGKLHSFMDSMLYVTCTEVMHLFYSVLYLLLSSA